MLGNNVVDYMINSCKGVYNLENAKLIKRAWKTRKFSLYSREVI